MDERATRHTGRNARDHQPIAGGKDDRQGAFGIRSFGLPLALLCGGLVSLAFFSNVASAAEPILLIDLPAPPETLASLVDTASVSFEHGPVDAPRRIDSRTLMAAETSYKINFDYQTRLRWRIRGPRIEVRVNVVSIGWKLNHVIWFRRRPKEETFWQDRLVKHEFDHVRISADPRLESAFRARVAQWKTFTMMRSEIGDQTIDQAAKAIVRQRLSAMFRDITDLASIRYRELDRVTLHGRLPLPENADASIWDYSQNAVSP